MEPVIGVLFLVGLFTLGLVLVGWVKDGEEKKKREAERRAAVRREADRRENGNFRQGQEALDRGDLDLALSCANEELRRDSARIRGRQLRGQVLYHKGMYKQAIEDYCLALRIDGEEADLYRLRADCYIALGIYTQAIADYSDAIRLNPADTTAIERRKAAYAEREARGDAPPDDLPGTCAILAELPPLREEDTRAYSDRDQLSPPIPRPAMSFVLPTKVFNPLGLTGFILGLASVPFYFIGLIPILGIVFSGIALGRFNPETQKGKWMAGWGLGLSILFTFMYLSRR